MTDFLIAACAAGAVFCLFAGLFWDFTKPRVSRGIGPATRRF